MPQRFDLTDNEVLVANTLLTDTEVGILSVVTTEGYPRAIPVNFVAHDFDIYIHGAGSGEKYDLLSKSPQVSFAVYIPYSMILSEWRSPKYACGATQYYMSLNMYGRGEVVDDIKLKADALQWLMEKHEPNAEFVPIKQDEPIYRDVLKKTQIFKVTPEQMTVKVKMGQNLTAATRSKVIEHLKVRGETLDLKTAELMVQYGAMK